MSTGILKHRFFILAALILSCLDSQSLHAQVRAGSAYLKILPGTRQQNLAGGMTAGLDEPFSLYANPAAAGLLRELQLSFSYNRWISDIENGSLLFGKQGLPGLRKLNFALGLNVQGVDFESTAGRELSASARDWVLSASIGTPMPLGKHTLSLGGSFKYLDTELGGFSGRTYAFDAGLLFRTRKYRLTQDPRGTFSIFSFALSRNHMGRAIRFISERSPLPTTWRLGAAANIGRHDGPQLQFVADYQNVRDEVDAFSVGGEIQNFLGIFLPDATRLSRLLAIRGGYHFNSNRDARILSKFTLGLSLRLDDYAGGSLRSAKTAFPPRNSAVRADLGFFNSSTFDNVYQGSGSWFKTGPETFGFQESDFHSRQIASMPDSLYWEGEPVNLAWQLSNDPDLFDHVNYLLIMSDDSSSVQQQVQRAKKNGAYGIADEALTNAIEKQRFLQTSSVVFGYLTQRESSANARRTESLTESNGESLPLTRTQGGIVTCSLPVQPDSGSYYWSVLAYDSNLHMRPIGSGTRNLARFHIRRYPDLHIKITKTELSDGRYRAELVVADSNATILPERFAVRVDAFPELGAGTPNLATIPIDGPRDYQLTRGGTLTIPVSWDTGLPPARVRAEVNLPPYRKVYEKNDLNNSDEVRPPWFDLSVEKRAMVGPFTPKVQFATSKYKPLAASTPLLRRLNAAFRSTELQRFFIRIDGHTDTQPYRGTPAESFRKNCLLSLNRAKSVKASLLALGGITPGRISFNAFGQTEERFRGAKTKKEHERNRRVEIQLLEQACSPVRDQDCAALPTNCSAKTIKLMSSDSVFSYEVTIRHLDGSPARDFALHEEIPANMVVYDFEVDGKPAAPIRKRTLDGGTELTWHFDQPLPAASNGVGLTVKYKAKIATPGYGAFRVTSKSWLDFGDGVDRVSSNNHDADTVYVVGRPQTITEPASSTGPDESPEPPDRRGPPEPLDVPDRPLPPRAGFSHTVQCGETLFTLAEYYYGDGRHYTEIYQANNAVLTDANNIKEGQELLIPEIAGLVMAPNRPGRSIALPQVSVTIFGNAEIGSRLVAAYDFRDNCAKQGKSILRWYADNRLVYEHLGPQNQSIYTVKPQDAGSKIRFEVTPVTVTPDPITGKTVSIEIGRVPKRERDRNLASERVLR